MIASKRDVEIIQATIRRIAVAATLASNGCDDVPLAMFQQAMVTLAKDGQMHKLILGDVAVDGAGR